MGDITPSNVSFDNFEHSIGHRELMVFNEKLPFGRCSWNRCSENIKDVVSFSKWKKHLVRGVPMKGFS